MLNPYLRKRENLKGTTLKAELKRLLGHPVRFLASLVLILLPLLVFLFGVADCVVGGLYSLTHRLRPDDRTAVAAWVCLANAGENLCRKAQLNYRSPVRLLLWVFVPPHPAFYMLPLVLAFLAFVSIGNPRVAHIGTTLLQVLGLKTAKTKAGEFLTEMLLPPRSELWKQNWLVGRAIERLWFPDPGYFEYQEGQNLIPYFLNTNRLRTNLMIVAPPGSGKTFSVYYSFIHYARANQVAAIFFDSKGEDFEANLFDLNFDLNRPERSFRINLFTGGSPAKAGERLGEALIPELSEERKYFSDVAKDAMSALVNSHVAISGGVYPELSTLLLYLSQNEKLTNLREKVVETVVDRQGNLTVEGQLMTAGLDRIKQLAGTKNDALGSLITALTPLTTPEIARLLVANPDPQAHAADPKTAIYTIEELLRSPRLIRLSLPIAGSRIAPIIGRLILNQFNSAVLDPKCNTSIFKVACVDEAHNFISNSIAKGMVQARSNNAGFMLAFQTLSQIPDERMLETIFAASGTKLVMAGVGDKDADRFSRTFGDIELQYVSHSQSQSKSSGGSRGSSTSSASAFEFESNGSSERGGSKRTTRSNNQNQSSVRGESMNEQVKARRQFLPSEIRGLKKYHAIIESSDAYGSRYPSQVIDMTSTVITAMEATLKPKPAIQEEEKEETKLKADTKIEAEGSSLTVEKLKEVGYTFSWGNSIHGQAAMVQVEDAATPKVEVVNFADPSSSPSSHSYTAPAVPGWINMNQITQSESEMKQSGEFDDDVE